MARRLARAHGLRLYSADTRTWIHRDRALDAGVAHAERWEALAPSERWDRSDGDLVEMSLHVERGPMVIDDLRALPPAPLIIAEGSTLPASVVSSGVADRAQVVWLLPTPAFQDAQLMATGVADGLSRLARLLLRHAEGDARDHGLNVLVVDGSQAIADVVTILEREFRAALAAGPVATGLEERRQLLREMNEDVVNQIRGYHRRPWAVGQPELVEALFVCECGRPTCEVEIPATVGQVAGEPLFAAGHW
jgi:hypothetical protein